MINKSTHKKQVKDYPIDAEKFWSGVKKAGTDECWEWQRGKNTTGYGLFAVKTLPDDYARHGRTWTQILAHRVAASLHIDIKPKDYVMHKCDNRLCCNPDHLQVGTALDNMLDAISKGRHRGPIKMS